MGALTESTAQAITEFSGTTKVVTAKLDGAATGTFTVSGISTILAVHTQLCEDSTADCCGFSVSVSSSVVTIKGIEGDGTTNTQNALDLYVTVIGY